VNLTGSSPLTKIGMVDFVPCRAVIEAAQRKHVKYEAKCKDIVYGFLSFAFSYFGELEKDVVTLLKRIQKFSMAQDIRACIIVHMVSRINFVVMRAQIVSRLFTNFVIIILCEDKGYKFIPFTFLC
jgi:7-cyano-7-deazaguanine synthase in queuosine biosynthesis